MLKMNILIFINEEYYRKGDVIDKCNKKELFSLLSYKVKFLDKRYIKSDELLNQIIYSIKNQMKTIHHF